MARTAEGAALTARHYRTQLAVRAAAAARVTRLWALVDPTNLRGTYDRFVLAAVPVVQLGFQRSAAISAAYFTAFRTAERAGGSAAAVVAPAQTDATVAAGLLGAGLSGIVNARRRGMTVEASASNGLVKVVGQVAVDVLAGSRATLIDSLRADRRAAGWMRVTSASPCDFCRDIADGGVASKEAAVDFETHGHCSCSAEPAYVQ